MPLKLHGVPMATCTQRVLLAAYELGLEVEIVLVDFQNREHKSPAFLEKQPFGQIPYLEDGDLVMYESRAIIRYLNEKAGNKLGPKDLKHRAVYEQWFDVESQEYNKPISALVSELVFKPVFYKQPTDEAVVKAEAEKLGKTLDVIEKHLAKTGQKFITGDTVTLADVPYVSYGALLLQTPQAGLITSRPHVKAWFDRLIALPSWQKVQALAKH